MENIDVSFKMFNKIIGEIEQYKKTIFTEQDSRVKVLDRIFTKVLDWPYSSFLTEERASSGYLDYKFMMRGLARLIVEAKRDGRGLGLDKKHNSGCAYKLNGPVFKNKNSQEGIEQAIKYCGVKNAELACVSNGREWIIFRGSRLGDGRDTTDGVGFVFTNLDKIRDNFSLFYKLLSYESIEKLEFRAYFQEAEGQPIRFHNFCKSIRAPGSEMLLPRDKLAYDLDKVMLSFFRRLTGDENPKMLAKCFVVTRESRYADDRLLRISEDLAGKVKSLETLKGETLIESIKRVKATHRHEFVLIVGTKGAGKTTFIDRFFTLILPKKLLNECVVMRMDLRKSNGDINTVIDWMNKNLLEAAEQAVFENGVPKYNDLQGMFYDEYKRWRAGPYKYLYDNDKNAFKIKFGEHVETKRTKTPYEYICRLIKNIISSRKKIPCIVFDNADHFTIEFQEKVFQYARSIYEQAICLMIIPLTDRTTWQLSNQGVLQSFDSETLFLPTPDPKVVVEKRIKFFEECLAYEKRQSGRGYFFTEGITLSLKDLNYFAICLQKVFLETGWVSRWIGNLSNYDVRQCLELVRNIMASPHLKVHDLFKAYVAGNSIVVPVHIIKKGIIRDKYDIYPVGQHKFLRNIYSLSSDFETTPLLGLRILQMLRDVPVAKDKSHFIDVQQVYDYFQAMTIDPQIMSGWLDKMLKASLCVSYDPTIININKAEKIELAPSGKQHFFWGVYETNYILAMMYVTPILKQEIFSKLQILVKVKEKDAWREKIQVFADYLLTEDVRYCNIPAHEAYAGQRKLMNTIHVTKNKIINVSEDSI
ncbi:MAG: AAA family ATPase [Candidatus Omnitrophica bacterium]|nr:AAA family ATPase [Candidatus Omnitrophota bacterium]MCF7895793.1 AAA family ATPase [Candidatus Omnitrophota bacterium]MCF7898052.1 AAA family ATPase [Candidatus Omnitrophota bacterium]